jgi:YVTN family beta-propeller protein
MKTLYLSIVTAIGVATIVSFGIFILSTPHPNENARITASYRYSNFAGITVNPVTDRVYACESAKGFVYVFDGHTNKTLDIIPIHALPWGVAVNPATNKIYVVNRDSDIGVSVIDGFSDKVIKNINVTDMGTKPPTMIFNAFRGGQTYKIDPVQVAVNPKTNRIYVSDWNYWDGGVTVIDGSIDVVTDTIIGLGGGSWGIDVNPVTDRIYVDNLQYGYKAPYKVSVIDGATDKILTNVTIGMRGPHGVYTVPAPTIVPLAVNPSTNLIYAACGGCITSDQEHSRDWIAVINGTANTVVDSIPLSVLDITVNQDTNTLYATLGIDPINLYTGSFRIAVIDGQTNNVTKYLKSDYVGSNVAVNPKNGILYVTGQNMSESSVSLFNVEK